MNNDIALTESTYYILLSLFEPQHGYGIAAHGAALRRAGEACGGDPVRGAQQHERAGLDLSAARGKRQPQEGILPDEGGPAGPEE